MRKVLVQEMYSVETLALGGYFAWTRRGQLPSVDDC